MMLTASSCESTGRSLDSEAIGKLMRMGWRWPIGSSSYTARGSSATPCTLHTP